MNVKLWLVLLTLTVTACSNPKLPDVPIPPVEVKIPVAVPCVKELPKRPDKCVIKDSSRPEKLRCILVDKLRNDAYAKELEAILETCKE